MQKYRITADNRRDIVKKLEEMLRERAIYTKMPRCAYIIRSIAIEKDGTVFIEDPVDLEIIYRLQELGMIEPIIEIEEANLEEDIMRKEERTDGKTITVMLPIHPKKEIVPKEEFESHDFDPSAYDCLIEEPDPLYNTGICISAIRIPPRSNL